MAALLLSVDFQILRNWRGFYSADVLRFSHSMYFRGCHCYLPTSLLKSRRESSLQLFHPGKIVQSTPWPSMSRPSNNCHQQSLHASTVHEHKHRSVTDLLVSIFFPLYRNTYLHQYGLVNYTKITF